MSDRRIALLSLFFLLFAGLILCHGFDFGANLDNSTAFKKAADNEFLQENRLSLWLDAELGTGWYFMTMGSYTLEYQDEELDHYLDLDRLYFEGSLVPTGDGAASNFDLTVGRFVFSEFTGNVLRHVADGVKMDFLFPAGTVSVSFGYTGLLFKHMSDVRMSKTDVVDATDDDVWFAPPRIIGAFDATFPDLLGTQSLTLSFLFQEDMTDEDELIDVGEESFLPAQGGRIDTQYIGLGLGGPIISSLYYDTFFYLGTGRTLTYANDEDSATGSSYRYENIVSYLFGGSIKLYMKELLYSRVALSVVYASGDPDHQSSVEGNTEDFSTAFVPISYNSGMALIFAPLLSNVLFFDLSYSLRPLSGTDSFVLSRLQTVLKTLVFFRPTTGPISEAGIDYSSNAAYLGTEIDLIVTFRPFSDLGVSLGLGLFLPNAGGGGAFLESERETEFMGQFELSLSL